MYLTQILFWEDSNEGCIEKSLTCFEGNFEVGSTKIPLISVKTSNEELNTKRLIQNLNKVIKRKSNPFNLMYKL